MTSQRISVCEPLLDGKELEYASEAIRTGWISSVGSFTTRLEQDFAAYCGTDYATTTNNGTTALHLACLALELGPGDEVIMPDFTMIASAFAVCYVGAMPVFVDAESYTWNLDPAQIEAQITPKTKAIMAVHIYGHPCDWAPIAALAKKYNLALIEDAAEVHGATWQGRRCGSLGDIACFSLFANKIMTSGEGGLVTTSRRDLYEKCLYFKNLCFPVHGPRNYIHHDIGFNFRLPNTLAAIALAQLERIDALIQLRRKHQHAYRVQLEDVPGLHWQPEREDCTNVYWMVGVRVDAQEFGMDRDALMAELQAYHIETRPFFYPMHKQPALLKYGCTPRGGDFPVSRALSQDGFYLPSSSGLKEEQIQSICSVIRGIQERKPKGGLLFVSTASYI